MNGRPVHVSVRDLPRAGEVGLPPRERRASPGELLALRRLVRTVREADLVRAGEVEFGALFFVLCKAPLEYCFVSDNRAVCNTNYQLLLRK